MERFVGFDCQRQRKHAQVHFSGLHFTAFQLNKTFCYIHSHSTFFWVAELVWDSLFVPLNSVLFLHCADFLGQSGGLTLRSVATGQVPAWRDRSDSDRGVHISEERNLHPTAGGADLPGSKAEHGAHAPTVQWAGLEVQLGRWYIKNQISFFSNQSIWTNARKLQILHFGSNGLSFPLDVRYSQWKVNFHPEDFSFVEVVFSIRKPFQRKITNWF